ncbi:MAG: leucine-rich repeat protein [Clostridium sp.]
MKKFISSILIFIFVLTVTSNINIKETKAITNSDWEYELEFLTENAMITGYHGEQENLEIPSQLDDKYVIEIGLNAFRENEIIKNVSIPNNVKKVGEGAFDLCVNLKGVTLPKNIKRIYDNTFRACSSLETIDIPEKVTTIGDNAFLVCESLTEITIPKNVVYIGESAFNGCSNLVKAELPDVLTIIENSMFGRCNNLKEINLPSNLKKIGIYAFADCTALTNLEIPESVEEIEAGSFANSGLEELKLPKNLKVIPVWMADGCKNLKSVEISKGTEEIKKWAFRNCESLEKVIIPVSVKEIYEDAFDGCSENLVIYGEKGSYAETYAKENSIPFKDLYSKELNIKRFSTNKISPQITGTKVTLTTEADGTGTLQYKYYIYLNGEYKLLKDWSNLDSLDINLDKVGTYDIYVGVKDSTGEIIRKNLIIKAIKPLGIESFTSDKQSPQKVGTTIKLTTKISGDNEAIQYKYYRYLNGKYALIKDWNTSNTITIAPKTIGNYDIYVGVKDSTGDIVRKNIKFTFE